ncbi:MAG: 16S rRNA (adenine(1518)-N(6)/adenine(1519)-N(6))-dimethyltransferase RsmA [Cellvibrionaceae bacterium]
MEEHTPRKRFGQNFLTDSGIIEKIVRYIAPEPTDNLIEIGPGQGAITIPLLAMCSHLNVVELDRDLVARLTLLKGQYPDLTIHQGDALAFDFSTLACEEGETKSLRILGNLPYNISTPLIFHLLSFSDIVKDMHFMLQKEVVERMAAKEGSKTYGRLSVMVQYACKVTNLFPVPPECFNPRPKVDSAIVRLEPYQDFPYPADNLDLFKKLVNTCFQHRRKTLRNNLRALISKEAIEQLDSKSKSDDKTQNFSIDMARRPETLSVVEYVNLANTLHRDYKDELL